MRELSKRLKTVTPLRCEYCPVRIAARLGVQIEFVANTRVSSAPSRASRSRLGVVFTRDPYAPIACAAWSSVMMNTMFGRPPDCAITTAGMNSSAAVTAANERHSALGHQLSNTFTIQDSPRFATARARPHGSADRRQCR